LFVLLVTPALAEPLTGPSAVSVRVNNGSTANAIITARIMFIPRMA